MKKLSIFPAIMLVFFMAQPVFAHGQHGEATDLLTGLQHRWSGLDHVLAMLAVGLWGARLGHPAIWSDCLLEVAIGDFVALQEQQTGSLIDFSDRRNIQTRRPIIVAHRGGVVSPHSAECSLWDLRRGGGFQPPLINRE